LINEEEEIKQLNLVVVNDTLDMFAEPSSNPFIFVSKVMILLKRGSLKPSDNLRWYLNTQLARGYNQISFARYQKLTYKSEPYFYDQCIVLVK
jgi:hypothetical protein